jgi:uncharacterized phage protein (possible DNA packaging)
MILTLDEVKNYLRVDLDDDDALIQSFIAAAEAYLKNATGKEYQETDSAGHTAEYELEKVYLKLLIAYWYENRSAAPRNKSLNGAVPDEFTFSTRSLLLQLQL